MNMSMHATRYLLGAMLVASVLAGCAGPQSFRGDIPGQRVANTSAIVVAEIDFARQAQEKGQWTAFRDTAADDAIMFVPQLVRAQDWLKGRADPDNAVAWQPHELFMSCDGRTGASTGAWQRTDERFGYYTTIWQQTDKSRITKPDWKWHLDHAAPLSEPRIAEDIIGSRIASCAGDAKAAAAGMVSPASSGAQPAQSGTRASPDGTFLWSWSVLNDDAREVKIMLWNGSSYDIVLRDTVQAPVQ
jgi:hypothetical protein